VLGSITYELQLLIPRVGVGDVGVQVRRTKYDAFGRPSIFARRTVRSPSWTFSPRG